MREASARLDAGFDPQDAGFRADPYPAYHALRRASPFHYRVHQGDWIVTRYHDVAALVKDERLAKLQEATTRWENSPGTSRVLQRREEGMRLRDLWVVFTDPPDHTRVRKVLQEVFSPSSFRWVRGRVEELVDASIDRAVQQGSLDIVHDLGHPLAFTIICDVLDIPQEDRAGLKSLAPEVLYALDLDISPIAAERTWLAFMKLTEYFRGLIARWRHDPPAQDNVITKLMEARTRGDLSEAELISQCTLLFFAAQVNTPYMIGNGMLALFRHPDQLEMLRAQPELIETAVEELLRYDSPVSLTSRFAQIDFEFAGKTIRRGQMVHLMQGSANRDPEVFPDPDRLDITRHPNPHLSFGYGIHYCLGAWLGKMEGQVAIGALLRRAPRLNVEADELEWTETFAVRGMKSLPVVFDA